MEEQDYECPSCGDVLLRGQDKIGVTYQCLALDCMELFDADEIEPLTSPNKP